MNRDSIKETELVTLRKLASANYRNVNRLLVTMGRPPVLLKMIDRYRLLTLAQWAERYKVSLEYVVRRVVLHWMDWASKRKFRRRRRRSERTGFGIKVATIVGEKSEAILVDWLRRDFPNKENIEDWKWRRRSQMLDLGSRGFERPASMLRYKHLRTFVKSYRRRVGMRERRLDRASSNPIRRRRPYRDNPWL